MGAVFFGVSHENTLPKTSLNCLDAWIPFEAETSLEWKHHSQHCTLKVWQTHRESARGSYLAWIGEGQNQNHPEVTQVKGTDAFVYTGWMREDDQTSLQESVPTHFLRDLKQRERDSIQKQISSSQYAKNTLQSLKGKSGQFAGLYINSEGSLFGFHDGFCGQHLYVGTQQGEVVFSNRASLIALYLNGGQSVPQPRGESLIWMVARHESPLGDPHSAWQEAQLCFPDQGYWAHRGQLKKESLPFIQRSDRSWDDLYADLIWRAGQIKRLPQVRFELPLTGGLDSRLIFGALKEADCLSQVDLIWLRGEEEQADVKSARLVADAYQLPLQVISASDQTSEYNQFNRFLDRLPYHLFYVEHMINAWDLKVPSWSCEFPKMGVLPGHFGELYRSHALPFLSWHPQCLKTIYRTHLYMNRHHLLTPHALNLCIQSGLRWIQERVKSHVPASHLLDELHREARMWRWASQTQMFEGLGFPSINLLPDLDLRAKFATLSLKERLSPRVHFELTRRVDERLWTIPYAEQTWPIPWVQDLRLPSTSPSPQPACGGKGNEMSAQMKMWHKEKQEIIDFLLSPSSSSSFSLYIDNKKIKRKIEKTLKEPKPQRIKALLGLSAIKMGFEDSLKAYPLKRS